MTDISIVGICGSPRTESNTRRAVEKVVEGASDLGADTEILDLSVLDIPLFTDSDSDDSTDLQQFKQTIEDADGLVIGSPMYHGSYSGIVKNAIDHCGFDEFSDTDVALVGVSGGQFPRPTVHHLRAVCIALNARVLPRTFLIPSVTDNFTEDGEWDNATLKARGYQIGKELYEQVSIRGSNSE